MHNERRADYILLTYFLVLVVFGLVALTSASIALGQARFDDSYFYVKRQILYGFLPGIVAFLFLAKFEYRRLKRLAWPIYLFCLALLVLVFIPGIGSAAGTSTNSWLVLVGHSFQPSELAKLGLISFLSLYLSSMGNRISDLKTGFIPALFVGMVPLFLVVLQPDIGTVSIMFSVVFAMLFFAGAKLWHLGALAAIGIFGLILMVVMAPYRAARLTTFLHPELDTQGVGYHINQAFLAVGSGGFLGLGLGHSRQKFQYLPEVHADSIFAVIAEEMGFLFSTAFVLLLVLIANRSLKIAKHAPDQFGKLLLCGIIVWFISQSFLNIGAMVGLMPLTGVPLPFVSHGGTALLVSMAAVGILINVSKHSNV
jgi:cell division protein FtsW